MFHPHFLDQFFGNPHGLTDTMQLISAFKVEQNLQQTWREEGASRSDVEGHPEGRRGKLKFEFGC